MQRPTLFKRLTVWGICILCLWLALPNAFYSHVERHNDLIEQGQSVAANQEVNWPSWLSSRLVNLGLDLRGGAHLMAEVDVQGVAKRHMDAMWPELRTALREQRDRVGGFRRLEAPEGELRLMLSDTSHTDFAKQAATTFANAQGFVTGTADRRFVVSEENGRITLKYSEAGLQELRDRVVAQSLEVIRKRIDEAGTREPTIVRQGADRIVIEVPGIFDAEALKSLIGTTAHLSFHPVLDMGRSVASTGLVLPAANTPDVYYQLDPRAVVTGEQLVDAHASFDQNSQPAVSFRFDASGTRAFSEYTARNVGAPFAIVLDDKVLSAPVIQGHIPGGSGIITGNFSVKETVELSTLLRAGALPAELNFLEERTVGPELGQDSINSGAQAAIVGIIAVCVLMVACYGSIGLVATFGLIVNMTLLIGLLSLIGSTLTLPGIAGIVLTIGMAVDANVLIFERIREEMRADKNTWRAVGRGFDHAFSAILDSNLTGLLTAGLMFWLGVGPVRGFAVTMGLGIMTSMFTAVFVTKLVLQSWLHWRGTAKLKVTGLLRYLPEKTSIDFFRVQWATFGLSLIAVVAALVLVFTAGLNLGIDFTGGTSMRVETQHELQLPAYRGALAELGYEDVVISEVFTADSATTNHVASIRLAGDSEAAEGGLAQVKEALLSVDPELSFSSVESIGGKVSPELVSAALWAIGGGIVAILVYIWFRFEWQFALGAVSALVHDIVVTLGVFALFGLKVDLTTVAALLTILGYSINDTVVVFDRVRENLRRYKKMPLRDLLNLSANETLSRTMMTSLTTLVALIALLVLGGDVIRGFVFAITFGVVIGTYSSLYVAKNIVLMLGVDRRSKEERQKALEFQPKGA
ncbi:protein translocase subunit SecD [Pseudovibrio exalbescens]|uniref:protein translocase subunit SecD n=1 Tax=Pseudovibrio exalbescens TaxID=197461 RepID=UPI002366106A|nr:protein translocase subunit SecD [Pseudovibrio exalbescens]MDD7908827.1 protein translocase subunit SecD [Pseudovibrio exalbescens]